MYDKSQEGVENSSPQFPGLPDPATLDLFGSKDLKAPVVPEGEVEDNSTEEEQVSDDLFIPQEPETDPEDNTDGAEDNLIDDLVPDKFRGKSREDIVKAYENLETKLGEQSSVLSTRKEDLETYDTLMSKVNGPKGLLVAKALDAILREDFTSLNLENSQNNPPEDDYANDYGFDDDVDPKTKALEKHLKLLESKISTLTEQLNVSKPAVEHSQAQLAQKKTLEMVSNAASVMKNRHNIDIDINEMIAFGNKYNSKYNFQNWNDVAQEYTNIQLRKADAVKREAQRGKNSRAPRVNPDSNQQVYTSGAKYSKWGDLREAVAAQLKSDKII